MCHLALQKHCRPLLQSCRDVCSVFAVYHLILSMWLQLTSPWKTYLINSVSNGTIFSHLTICWHHPLAFWSLFRGVLLLELAQWLKGHLVQCENVFVESELLTLPSLNSSHQRAANYGCKWWVYWIKTLILKQLRFLLKMTLYCHFKLTFGSQCYVLICRAHYSVSLKLFSFH